MVVGGKKKGKKQKKVKEGTNEKELFNIDVTIINKFGFLKVSPPLGPNDLANKVTELQTKKEEFEKEGQKKLDEEEEKLGEMTEENYEEAEGERERNGEREYDRPQRGFRGGRGGKYEGRDRREPRRER